MRKSALALSFVSAFSACGGNLALDYFRYVGEGQRDVTFEVACPSRVRGKLEAFRAGTSVASTETTKARQSVVLSSVATQGQPIVLRVSQAKGDGNANEPYSLKITSAPSPNTPARD
jgi:hypothetical protein